MVVQDEWQPTFFFQINKYQQVFFVNEEWWDVKNAVKNMAPDHDPRDVFKPGWISPIRKLPTADDPKYIRIDPAHTYAIDGIGKSYSASSIILLMHMGWFGNGSIDDKFKNAFCRFMAYCEAYGKNTSITEFSHKVFKLPQNSCLVSHCNHLFVFLDCPDLYIHFLSTPKVIQHIPMFLKILLCPSG